MGQGNLELGLAPRALEMASDRSIKMGKINQASRHVGEIKKLSVYILCPGIRRRLRSHTRPAQASIEVTTHSVDDLIQGNDTANAKHFPE
jgi:hypothetical protein